jgi:hypothetical protein
MERIAIFRTDDGGEVAIQVVDDGLPRPSADQSEISGDEPAEAGGSRPDGLVLRGIPNGALASRGIPSGRLVERTQHSLDEVLSHARPAVSALLRQVRAQEDAPDELEVEFGIQISLEVGAYIAAASSTANFRVTMRWMSRPG